jgi:uncharacterized protein YdeI (YjbR/CyaY-like superfamily)
MQPAGQAEFREWLTANHATEPSVWLVLWKKSSGKRVLGLNNAIDEALCFGWIDSKSQPVDDERYEVYFSVRKPGGTWSKVNKDNIELLIRSGRMTASGLAAIDRAKADGSWTILDGPEAGIVPDDLADALAERDARSAFVALTGGRRKTTLAWIELAKRPETRERRIAKTVEAVLDGRSPLE